MTRSINAGRRDEKPLMNFTEYHTFQGFYKVTPSDKDQTPEYAFNRCILHITNWLKNRIKLNKHYDSSEVQFLYDYPEPDSLLTEGFDVFSDEDLHLKRAKKQFDISIFAIKEFGEWTIRIREPNNQSEKGYLDWLFTTDIALKISGDFVYLAVRTKCKESHSHGKKASPFRTKCLQYIFKDESLIVSEGGIVSHNYPVNMKKLNITRSGNRKNDEYEFIKIIKDTDRQMPVIFCPAFFNAEDEKNGFRITKLSEHLSGMAYVVTDEPCNGYKDLFKERMAEFLKEIGIKPVDALTLITAGYLCIDSISDGAKTQWFMIDPHVRDFETLDNTCEKVIRKEIGQVEEYVRDRMLSIDSDISFGETLFYSELWKKYINSSDSKRLEEAIAEREAAEQRIKLLIESHEEDTAAKIETVMKEFSEPRVAVVFHDASVTDANLKVIAPSTFKLRGGVRETTFGNLFRLSYIGCCMAFRAEYKPVVVPIPTIYRSHDWWTGCLLGTGRTKMKAIHKPLIYHRNHGDNVTPNKRPPLWYQLQVRWIIIKNIILRYRRKSAIDKQRLG